MERPNASNEQGQIPSNGVQMNQDEPVRGIPKDRLVQSNESVEISSDSDGEYDVTKNQEPNDGPAVEFSSEEWLLRRAKSYQEYMKLIPIPVDRGTQIPYASWMGLGSSIKQIYGQPLHYLTNIHLKRLDQERVGAQDEHVPLQTIIHPVKAEMSIWLMEEVHRRTSSPHHLAKLWKADPKYHTHIDAIFPHLGK